MRRELIETGKTVEDAINTACEQLGCDRDKVEWEIMDLPKKGFLGLKNIPAKVKVWIEEADKPAAKTEKPAPRAQSPGRDSAPAARQEQPAKRDAAASAPNGAEERQIEMSGDVEIKTKAAVAYLDGVCKQMGIAPSFEPEIRDGGVCINVVGEGLGAIIGRRGETLDALQYLSGLVANRLEGEYLRITVDCGDYRTKRRATLEALAQKLSSQVLKTNVSKTLEPMNPFERRIIHATVSAIEGVSSTSVGEEPNRRVVITSPTARAARPPRPGGSRGPRDGGRGGDFRGSDRGGRPPRRDSRDGGRGGDRDRRPPRRDSRDSGPRRAPSGGTINTIPQGPPKKTPESTGDQPLYTKLDLE